MSGENAIHIPIAALEDLRCSVCKEYLSCNPIRLLPDGNCICGHCSYSDTTHRVLPLETILSKMLFPCQFKDYGCKAMLTFGQTNEHESECTVRSFACPVVLENCSGRGEVTKLSDHFTEKHSNLIKKNAAFKLKITENAQEIFMFFKDSVTFIAKYLHNANDNNLTYDVRYYANQPEYSASYKLQLVNDVDNECNINLKSKKCLPYADSFYDMQNACSVDLNKFLPSLDSPDVIAILLKLKVVKTPTPEVDLGLTANPVDLLKCGNCYDNLIPPLFNLDKIVVCYKCGKNDHRATPLNNAKLLKRVNEAEFSCCWHNCNFVRKSDIYKVHKLSCEFRIYRCTQFNQTVPLKCKNINLKSAEIVEHYEKIHGAQYLPDKITYKTSFLRPYNTQQVFTIICNEIIGIQHKILTCEDANRHKVNFFTSTSPANITVYIRFGHLHCKVHSKSFNIPYSTFAVVTLKDLPPCFRYNEELTVNVTAVQIA